MDSKVKIPRNAILKKLQHRPRRGAELTSSVSKDEGSAFSKDNGMSQVDIVCKLLTMSHVQAGHGRVSMGGLVSDREDEGDEDVAGSQVMGSQGAGKGSTKHVASHKSKVQHIVLWGVFNPDECTYRGLPHRRLLTKEHVAEVRHDGVIFC